MSFPLILTLVTIASCLPAAYRLFRIARAWHADRKPIDRRAVVAAALKLLRAAVALYLQE
ncbi:hypothetical protein WME90_12185 [Sorangium sp. So ce375]|uniref:hypothetical protein n=1 Tax=Sorangium sp. So ce375 TaxID=3133306 RepID=UPI003F5B6DAB